MHVSDITISLRLQPTATRKRIVSAVRSEGTLSAAAAKLGCSLRTLQRMLAGDSELARLTEAVRSETSLRLSEAVSSRWV
jgi:AraC-like DNA-binding protein